MNHRETAPSIWLRRNAKDQLIFFPFGRLGRARVVVNEREIRRINFLTIGLGVVGAVVFYAAVKLSLGLWVLGIASVFLASTFLFVWLSVRSLPTTSDRYIDFYSPAKQVRSRPSRWLWAAFAVLLSFDAVAAWLILYGRGTWQDRMALVPLGAALFFWTVYCAKRLLVRAGPTESGD